MERTIPRLLRAAVDDVPDQAWLQSDDGELTYADALGQIERAAAALRVAGVSRGDRVLVTARNTADYLLSWFALMEVGAIQVPVNPKSSGGRARGLRAAGAPGADRDRRRRWRRRSTPPVAERGRGRRAAVDVADALRRRARRPRARPTSTSPTSR